LFSLPLQASKAKGLGEAIDGVGEGRDSTVYQNDNAKLQEKLQMKLEMEEIPPTTNMIVLS
jgi:hypothetical protein